jgi:homoserine kinase
MRKVKIILPATVTNFGTGLNSLGLALGLHATVEITERHDERLVVETEGEGAGRYPLGLMHPVVLSLMRVFQRLERAPLGITIRVTNQIPLGSGLGAEAAFLVAGVMAANNFLGNVYNRNQIMDIAAQVSQRPDHVITAILGGLTTSALDGENVIYRALPITGFKVVVALPEMGDDYVNKARSNLPDRVLLRDAVHNLSRLPLLVDALRSGDLKTAASMLDDRMNTPLLKPLITGYDHVNEMARRAGALGVTLSGNGPAMIFLAEDHHKKIADAVAAAFQNSGVKARTWTLPIDTQGVIISVAQSA